MNIKKHDKQYFGTTAILESEPIDIPNARQCCINHGLVTVIPFKDITFDRRPEKVILENKQK